MKLYTHIGADRLVRKRDIIGFFDLDGAVTPEITAEFLKLAELDGITSSAGDDLPRSFVLMSDKRNSRCRTEKMAVIFSHISSSSLALRVKRDESDGAVIEAVLD